MKQQWVIAAEVWLWLLPALAVVGVVLWFVWRRITKRRLAKFVMIRQLAAIIPTVSWPRRAVRFIALLLVMMLLAVALARPVRGPLSDNAESMGVDFVIALDISRSMWTEDVAPNRLAAVKQELGDWIKRLNGDRIGLVAFAGEAFVQAPVTFDYIALNNVLQQASPKSTSIGGTSISKAVEMAVHLLRSSESRTRCLVIITDGEDLEGDAINAVREARQKDNLTVVTVGVGTITGDKVPNTDYAAARASVPPGRTISKQYVTNEYGRTVTSRLDNRTLRLIAEAGGGRYYELRPNTRTFETLRTQSLQPLASLKKTLNLQEFTEWYQLPLGIAIALLALIPLLPIAKRRKRIQSVGVNEVIMPDTLSDSSGLPHLAGKRPLVRTAVLGAAVAVLVAPQAIAAPWNEAEALLAAKKPDEAVALMRQAVQTQANDQWLNYNYALTLYRTGRYEEAVAAFQVVRMSAQSPVLIEKAAIQMGNAQVKLGETLAKAQMTTGAILSLERAIGHYDESAADLSPEASHNRAIAAARLEMYLRQAGNKFKESAEKAADKPTEEERLLRNAIQAFDRIAEINEKNQEAPKESASLREKLAQNLSKQAKKLTDEADAEQAARKKPEEVMSKLEQAVAKMDDALAQTPQSRPLEQQKKSIENRMSDVLTASAEKQSEKPMQKEKLNDSEQAALTQARAKLDQALALNPDNAQAQDLEEKVSSKLEQSLVERGQMALADVEKTPSAQGKLNQALKAADQFQQALELNSENKPAQEGLAAANEKLPDLFAAAGDAEAAKAKEAMGHQAAKPTKPGQAPPKHPEPNLRKAVGFLEKADQNYAQALQMKANDAGLQERAQEVRDALNAARDQIDQQAKAELAAKESSQQKQAKADQPADQPKPGEPQNAEGTPQAKKPLSMAELRGNAKPKPGDNFWNQKYRDW